MAKTETKTDGKQPVKIQFRQDSVEFKKLVKLFQTGRIKAGDAPASVRSKYPDLFAQFTATQFRSQFHKARSMSGAAGTFRTSTP